MRRLLGRAQAEEWYVLLQRDDDRNAAGETGRNRERNEFDRTAKTSQPENYQDDPGHQRGDLKTCDTVGLYNAEHDDDECTGRSADLYFRATQRGDQEAGNNCGVKTVLRRESACDRERDCER